MDWPAAQAKFNEWAKSAQDHELSWFKAYSLLHPWTVQLILFGVGFVLGALVF